MDKMEALFLEIKMNNYLDYYDTTQLKIIDLMYYLNRDGQLELNKMMKEIVMTI